MNGNRIFSGVMATIVLSLFTGVFAASAAPPDGVYTIEFGDDAAVWDVSGTYDVSVGGIDLSLTINADDKGKLTGFGSTSTYMMGVHLIGDFTVTGSMAKSGSATKVTLNVKLAGTASYQGKSYKYTANEAAKTVVDPVGRRLTGTATVTGSVAGQSIKDRTEIDMPLNAGIDGVWITSMNLRSDPKNRVSGTGTVQISGGKSYAFDVAGTYTQKKGVATLNFKGQNMASKAASLKMNVAPSTGGMAVQTMNGRFLGQTVSKK